MARGRCPRNQTSATSDCQHHPARARPDLTSSRKGIRLECQPRVVGRGRHCSRRKAGAGRAVACVAKGQYSGTTLPRSPRAPRHECDRLQRFADRPPVTPPPNPDRITPGSHWRTPRRHWRAGRPADVVEDRLAGRRAVLTSGRSCRPEVERALRPVPPGDFAVPGVSCRHARRLRRT